MNMSTVPLTEIVQCVILCCIRMDNSGITSGMSPGGTSTENIDN